VVIDIGPNLTGTLIVVAGVIAFVAFCWLATR
jgi:hypothetical protein